MTPPKERILFVDDEEAVLDGLKRQLHRNYHLTTAQGGAKGLEALKAGPFAVVVSDYQMPEMNGVQFLAHAREVAPDTIRIMLTGQADMAATIEAVNSGNIFRFLTKPCPPDALRQALSAALEQWRLINAERVLLQRTLTGSVKVLTELLSLVHPTAFCRAQRIRRRVDRYMAALELDDRWQLPLAAMLSQIGCVTLPQAVIEKLDAALPLSMQEKAMVMAHPGVGRDVLIDIPRLEDVAEIVARQLDKVDPKFASVPLREQPIPVFGGQLLRIALMVDEYDQRGISEQCALNELAKQPEEYAPRLLEELRATFTDEPPEAEVLELSVKELSLGMVFAKDVLTKDGTLLVAASQEASEFILQRLYNYARRNQIEEPVHVWPAPAAPAVA